MFCKVLNQKQVLGIYCGINVLITGIILGLISIAQARWDWRYGMLFVIFGSVLVFLINVKKYRLIKDSPTVSFFRSVVIDSICLVLAFIGLWIGLFVPYPFSIEEFLQPSDEIVFPFGFWIIGALLTIPLICTNKIIMKEANRREQERIRNVNSFTK